MCELWEVRSCFIPTCVKNIYVRMLLINSWFLYTLWYSFFQGFLRFKSMQLVIRQVFNKSWIHGSFSVSSAWLSTLLLKFWQREHLKSIREKFSAHINSICRAERGGGRSHGRHHSIWLLDRKAEYSLISYIRWFATCRRLCPPLPSSDIVWRLKRVGLVISNTGLFCVPCSSTQQVLIG